MKRNKGDEDNLDVKLTWIRTAIKSFTSKSSAPFLEYTLCIVTNEVKKAIESTFSVALK